MKRLLSFLGKADAVVQSECHNEHSAAHPHCDEAINNMTKETLGFISLARPHETTPLVKAVYVQSYERKAA